jgi:hypothetical protein
MPISIGVMSKWSFPGGALASPYREVDHARGREDDGPDRNRGW